MKIRLKGGPAEGTTFDHPLPIPTEWLVPVEPKVDILDPFFRSIEQMHRVSYKEIAHYRFSGTAVIDEMGVVQWAILFHSHTEWE